ncbi:MAG: sensor histidine kinase [Betaproteobacteria bacterium]
MSGLAELGRRLRSAVAAPARTDEDLARIARNLRVPAWAGVVGGSLAGLANLAAGRLRSVVTPILLAVLFAGVLWLLRRGRVQAAASVSLVGLTGAVFTMLLIGEGVRDEAALLYPVVILLAALTLDGRLLAATTALAVLSVGAAVWFEAGGRLRTPFAEQPGWVLFANVSIILLVTAVAARLLVADIVRAVAEARARDQRLTAANRELEERSAEVERFTYVVSHDLKSPLVTIRGFLGYVECDAREGDLTRLAADIGRIRGATDRMARLLDDLLELSRTGHIDRPSADVALLDVVREARGLVEGRLGARGVRLEIEGPLPAVHGDAPRLVELFQNLLDNAAKFMGDQPDPRVWIGARPCEGGLVRSFVRDNGVGIDPAHSERVFELFHRLDPQQEGTGLGLALARRIVESHGGRIWVESAGAGQGSTFFFTLPAAHEAPAA